MSSLPVNVEGAKLFVSLPSGPDFHRFQTWMQNEFRRQQFAALPPGLPTDERREWLKAINVEASQINPFTHFEQLATNEGLPLLLHALVRHEQPKLDLDWATGLVDRANEGKASAKDGVRELLGAMRALMEAKKNELRPPEPEAAAAAEPSTSPPSSAPSLSDTA